MPIDLERVLRAAVQAALEEPAAPPADSTRARRKPFLRPSRAMLLGAGLVAAGRLAARGRGGELLGSLQERIADLQEELLDGTGQDDDADRHQEREAEDEDEEAAMPERAGVHEE